MTGKQHAVMWLGMILIIVRLFTTNQWSILWSTFTTNPNPGGPNNSSPPSATGVAQNIISDVQNTAHLSMIVNPNNWAQLGAQDIANKIDQGIVKNL